MHFLYLIRHSIIDPASARNQLSAEGEALALRFGNWLATSGYPLPTAAYSSDRPRATQTAALVTKGAGIGISTISDTRSDQRHPLLISDSCLQASGIPLTIIMELEENNPPEEVIFREEYKELTTQRKRAGLILDWEGKNQRVSAFKRTITNILDKQPSTLVASHGNIIQQSLQSLFPGLLDLSAFDGVTPHVGLTVIVKEGDKISLNRLFATEWRF